MKNLFIFSVPFLIIFGWYYFFYLSLQEEYDLKLKNLSKSERINTKFNKTLDNLEFIEKSNLNIKNNLNSNNILKESNDIDLFFSFLKKYKISCQEFSPIKIKKNKHLIKEYYQLKTKGYFENIINFLQDLKNSKIKIKFENIQFKRKSKKRVGFMATVRFINL